MKIAGNSKCTLCPLHKTTKRVCTMGAGARNTDIMIIGEAPGEAEERTGKPFQGKAGMLLNEALEQAGLERDDIYVTNSVQCRPPENRTPKRKEIEACRKWWKKEVSIIKPKYVMLLGNTACQAVLGKKGIKNLRGQPLEEEGVIYFPVYHPAFVLRDPRNEPVFFRDLETFAKIIKQKGKLVDDPDFKYTMVTEKNLGKALADIRRERWPALDTETSGLDPWAPGAYITSLGVGTKTNNWCFPLQHTKGELFDKPNAQKRLMLKIERALFANRKKKTFIGHNGKFDTNFIRVIFGLRWYFDFDTMLAHYNLDENNFHGLDHLAGKYFNAIDYDIPLEEKHGFGPIKRHCQYLGLDTFYTRKLFKQFMFNKPRYQPKRNEKEHDFFNTDRASYIVFKKLTMPVARMYADIEFNGVYVDPEKLKEAQKYWNDKKATALKALDKLVPSDNEYKIKKTKEVRRGVNWGSPDQVAEVLFGRLKLKPLDKTPKGKYSVSESVLLRLKDKHKVPMLILEYREADKNLGTFVEAWMRASTNSRLHPTFKVHGTVTGRPSCEEPNLQQTPRDPRIRSNITAPKGWTLVDADLSQIELRLTAQASKDKELCMSYATGVDVHTLTVQRVFGIMNPDKEQRKKGKAINFGFIYGMGWKKFKDYARDNYGVDFTDAECKKIRKAFFRLYAGLPAWHERQRKFARNFGYVRNLIGRKRRLPDAMRNDESYEQGEAERQAINSPIQSLASDMNLMAAVHLHQKFGDKPWFRIVGTVHDAILFEVRNDKIEVVLPEIKRAMENPPLMEELDVHLEIPIEAEIETGAWASGTKWNPANDNKDKVKHKKAA